MSAYLHFEQSGPIVLLSIYAPAPGSVNADEPLVMSSSFAALRAGDASSRDAKAAATSGKRRASPSALLGEWLLPLLMFCSAETTPGKDSPGRGGVDAP